MSYELIKANLNLYAVLKNLEDIVLYDAEIKDFAADWNISIQFTVKNGPEAYVLFENGKCIVARGKYANPSVKLFFMSPEHLNKMFDGKANPIPLKGFTKLGFLTKKFSVLTDRLSYYLKPTDELLKNKKYLDMNTRLTMTTAAFAVEVIGMLDPAAAHSASRIRNGTVLMSVSPKGPEVTIAFNGGKIEPAKGGCENPMAKLVFKNIYVANKFLNGKSDTFTAVALGDVVIKGQTAMLDSLSLILDRIPFYLT